MKRAFAVLGVVGAAVAVAAPAGAHEEISPASVPFGKSAFLVLTAANEKRVDLNRVAIAAPSGGELGEATRDPVGWTANLTHTNVTWTGGGVRPNRFEQFGFEIEGFNQPGTFTYRVTLGYADGSSEDAEVVVTSFNSTAGGGQASEAAASGTGHSHDDEPAETAAAGTEGDDSDAMATAALGVGVVALVVGVVGVLLARKAGRPAAERATPAGAAKGQDW